MSDRVRSLALTLALATVPSSLLRAQANDDLVGPPKPVQVINTPAQPIPVNGTVTGSVTVTNTPDVRVVNTPTVNVGNIPTVNVGNTANVNIANTPSVNARQSGAWNVTLDGTAQVQGSVDAFQAGTWQMGLDPLANTVRIDSSAPVAVRNVETTAVEPFQYDLARDDDGSLTVPEGKRLVIEFVTVVAFGEVVTGFIHPWISTTVGGQTMRHYLATLIHPFEGVNNETLSRYYQGSILTRIYADPGTEVTFGANRGQTNLQQLTISGHLVAVP